MMLIMMCGPSYSGKSTLAKEYAEKYNATIVATDDIREELFGSADVQKDHDKVFALAYVRIGSLLAAHHNVVFDATNLLMKHRMKFIERFKQFPVTFMCVVCATHVNEISRRATLRERVVPFDVVMRQIKQFQCPGEYEGWDIIEVRRSGDYVIEKDLSRAMPVSQDNHNHTLTIGKHCEEAWNEAWKLVLKADYSTVDCQNVTRAARYHDIGKLYTKEFKNMKGEVTKEAHFYGHHSVSSYFYLSSTEPGEDDISDERKLYIAQLIGWHMEPYFRKEKAWDKFVEIIGEELAKDILIIHKADLAAH